MKNLFSLLETQYDKFWQAEWFPVSDAFGKAEMLNKKLALNLHPPSTVSAAAAERKGDAGSSEKSFWTRVCNESHLKYVVTLHHVHISIIPIRQKKKN